MADPRLQWRQLNVSAPNVSGLMAGANDAWNSAFDTAGSVLKRYQAGQFEAGDREAAARLAALNDEAELDDFLAKGGLNDLNISPEMQKTLLGTRGNVLGYEGDRSIMTDRAGRLGIAQDINRRAGADWAWEDGRRRESAGLVDEVIGARLEGQQYGTNGLPQGDAFERYIASTINSESGGNANARNPNSSATGTAQFIDSTWQMMMAKYPELGLTPDGRTDPAQSERALRQFTKDNAAVLSQSGIDVNEGSLYAAHFLGAGGARAVLSQPDDVSVASIVGPEVVRANPFLANMTVGRFKEWSAQKGGSNAPATSRTPARDTLNEALANSQYLSLDDVNQILNGNDSKIAEGDTRIANDLAQTQQDLLATFISQSVTNPDNVTSAEVAKAVEQAALASGQFTQAEALKARQAAEAMIAESSSLQGELAPVVAEDLLLSEGINNTLADERRVFEGQDQNRALGDIERYTENPTQNLMNDLGLGSDGENPGGLGGLLGFEKGFDENNLRNLVNEYANRFGVEPEVVAVAMRDSFNRDPWGRNTLRNRFDEDTVREKVQQLTSDDRRDYDRGRSNITIMEGQMRQVESQINRARTQLAKMGPNDPRRAAIEANLVALDAQLAAIYQSNTNRTP